MSSLIPPVKRTCLIEGAQVLSSKSADRHEADEAIVELEVMA